MVRAVYYDPERIIIFSKPDMPIRNENTNGIEYDGFTKYVSSVLQQTSANSWAWDNIQRRSFIYVNVSDQPPYKFHAYKLRTSFSHDVSFFREYFPFIEIMAEFSHHMDVNSPLFRINTDDDLAFAILTLT